MKLPRGAPGAWDWTADKIIVDAENNIVSGHHRVLAAEIAGIYSSGHRYWRLLNEVRVEMGVEDFLVRVESDCAKSEAIQRLLVDPAVHRHTGTFSAPDYEQFRFEDPRHIIEIEVSPRASGSVVSMRFALCQPSSVDHVFANFVDHLARGIRGKVSIAEDVGPADQVQHLAFDAPDYSRFEAIVLDCIRVKRQQWVMEFGSAEARLSCKEALERFVMKVRVSPP